MRTRRSWRNQDRLFKELGKEKGVCVWQQDEDGLDYWMAATERLQRHKRQEVLPL